MNANDQSMESSYRTGLKICGKNIKFSEFTWILFLGVLPFDKAALSLYISRPIGEALSLMLNAITIVLAIVGVVRKSSSKVRKVLAQKYIAFFIVLSVIYSFSFFVDQIKVMRIFSLICLLGYYLFVICHYDNIDEMLKDINKALLFIMTLSLFLYILGVEQVMYIENATSTVFKGIVANRNTYSEISLFFIATNFYLWHKSKKGKVWIIITTLLAVVTTFLTNGITSIACVCLLLMLLISCNYSKFRKIYSFKAFSIFYIVLFGIIMLSQYSSMGILSEITQLFGKSSTFTGRTDIWKKTIVEFFDAPIFGHGYDTTILLDKGVIENDPHNGILFTILTQGITGLVVFVCMLLSIIKKDSQEIRKENGAYIHMLIFVAVWMIKGLVESVFSYTHFVFWCALIVMELSLYKSVEEKDEQ